MKIINVSAENMQSNILNFRLVCFRIIDTVKRNTVAMLNNTKSTEQAQPKIPPIIKLHVGKSAPPIIVMLGPLR